MPFEEKLNSFYNAVFELGDDAGIEMPPSEHLKSLNSISALYQYTNPPPMGYGTPAPKVVETVLRAYDMNKNEDGDKEIIIDTYPIANTVWMGKGEFPWFEPASNWCPRTMFEASAIFLSNNHLNIDDTIEKEMVSLLSQNSDILTKGRQTYCPLTESSLPCPRAYKNMMEFFTKNGSPATMPLFQMISEFFRILGKREVYGTKVVYKEEVTRQHTDVGHRNIKKQRKVVEKWHLYKGDDAFHYTLGLARSFCTYIKHGERAHLKRRAIASPNIIERAFLFIIESVHLSLGKLIEGSTISIGGEEKKNKIIKTMDSLYTDAQNVIRCQATEDATKWNETLSASLFGMMHKTFFDLEVRYQFNVPAPTEFASLYAKICEAAHFLLAIKRVTLGPGLQGKSNLHHGAIPFTEAGLNQVNDTNREWFARMLKLREGNNYIRASPGMLMGMMNAGSTTLGLISVNYLHPGACMMKTLRSSDDSMTIHAAPDANGLVRSMDLQYLELKVSGISLSPKKTLVFKNKYGEYTSWFQDGKLVSQFGPETTTLRPAGMNPHDDAYLAAKSVSISLLNCTSNILGGEIKLTLGINNVRSLYRILPAEEGAGLVPAHYRVVADGGRNSWDVANCHLEETSLKRSLCPAQYHYYFTKIRDPSNPFAATVEEQTYYDKEIGSLQVGFLDNPRTIFSYTRRGNRASIQKVAGSNAESEKGAQQVLEIIHSLDYSTSLMTPKEATLSGRYCAAKLELLRADMDLSAEESELYQRALRILNGDINDQSDDEVDVDAFMVEDSD